MLRSQGSVSRRRTICTSRKGKTRTTRAGAKSGPSCREDFAGIENVVGVEELLNPLHRRDRVRRQLHPQIRRLAKPDAVLARQGPTQLHRLLEELDHRLLGLL